MLQSDRNKTTGTSHVCKLESHQVSPALTSRGVSSESTWWLTLMTSAGRKGFVNL